MSFQQGLSGLNISSRALDAIGNNVANANTVGYKSAQAQFADVYAASLGGGGTGQIGIGASVGRVAQQFSQGNVTATNNPLDLAVNGNGMFRLSNNGVVSYTRNGQYQVDKDGYIVNGSGLRLTGYAADATGTIVPGNFADLQLVTTNIAPAPTTASQVQLNLDSRAVPPAAMRSGQLTSVGQPGTLMITGGNNTLTLTVDGLAASVDIPPKTDSTGGVVAYDNAAELAAAVETAINTHPTFAGAKALVDVDLNSSGQIVISSRSVGTLGSQGQGSTVAVTGGDGAENLLGVVAPAPLPTGVAGTDNFDPKKTNSYTGSTAQTVYDSLGNPHNLTMYFCKTSATNSSTTTWQVYTAVDGNFTGPTTTTSTYSIAPAFPTAGVAAGTAIGIVINGVTTEVPLITGGAYPDAAAMQADLQASIDAMYPVGARPTVSVSGGNVVIASSGNSLAIVDGATAPVGTVDTLFGAAAVAAAVSSASTVTTPAPTNMTFSNTGVLTGPLATTPLRIISPVTTGAEPLDFTLDFDGTSQYGVSFGVNQLLQDGYTSGRLSGLSVSADGIIQGRYSNGKSRNMGQLVLANFNNPNGLQSLGGNQWAETVESGQPIPGTPGQGSLGVIQSASVEEANVDLTAELVAMITQQRVYQANAQTIKTQDQVLSTLVNLR